MPCGQTYPFWVHQQEDSGHRDVELLKKISKNLDQINTWLGQSASWIAIPIIAVTIFDVVSRRFFTLGSVTLQELEWHFHAVLFMFCAGYAYIHDAHVRVDVFRQRLSPYWQSWIELAGCVVFLIPYCVLIIVLGFRFVADSFALNEISDAPGGLPYRYIIKSVLPVGFVFLLLQGISTALKQIVVIAGHQAQSTDPQAQTTGR